jgi:hypothetical protein
MAQIRDHVIVLGSEMIGVLYAPIAKLFDAGVAVVALESY